MSITTDYSTVADFVQLLDNMLASSNEAIADHAKTLVGPRTRGSTSNVGLDALPASTVVCPIEKLQKRYDKVDYSKLVDPGCRAFVLLQESNFEIRDWAADDDDCALDLRLGAESLLHVLQAGLTVTERSGAHGPELFVDRELAPSGLPRTTLITIILGEEAGQEVMFTWHPGLPWRPWNGHTVTKDTGVKLHNG